MKYIYCSFLLGVTAPNYRNVLYIADHLREKDRFIALKGSRSK